MNTTLAKTPRSRFIVGGIIAFVVIVLNVAILIGWREWTHSPTYSLKAVATSVEKRDRYQFEKHVDLDSILQSLVVDTADGNALASAIGGAVVGQLKSQIIKAVEDGSIPTDSQLGRGVQNTLSGKLPEIDRQGRNAYFTIPVTTKGGASFNLKLHMTQVPDGYWRIDRFANMKDLRALEDQEEKARRAAIAKANEADLAKLHVTAKLHTSITSGPYGWEKKNRFQVRFENKTGKTVASMTGQIRMRAQEFDQGIKGTDLDLAPGASANLVWEFDANRFIEPTMRVYALGETEQLEVDVESVSYSDGTKVKRGSDE